MAYLRRRADGRVEIRETVQTPDGPRARTLAIFRGPLDPGVLDSAQARARRPFDRAALLARAARLEVPVAERRADAAARALLAALHRGAALDPALAARLRETLEQRAESAPPSERTEAAEWIGVDARRRGEALRGLLRASDRLVAARPRRRMRPRARFPRFRSAS